VKETVLNSNDTTQRVPSRLIIASRESRLAMWQATHVRDRLAALYPHCQIDILGMTTRGDQILDRTLSKVGGKGLFVKELEVAMAEGPRRPGRALAQGRADGIAGRLRAGRRARTRRSARRLRLERLRQPGRNCRPAAWSAPAACAARP
jgi:hypothetical protein